MNVVSVAESWSGIEWSGDTDRKQTVRAFTVETDAGGRGVFSFPITDPSPTESHVINAVTIGAAATITVVDLGSIVTGSRILIAGIVGTVGAVLNGNWYYVSVSTLTLTLFTDVARATNVDTSGTAYTSDGTASYGVVIPAEGTAHPDDAAFISGVPTIRAKGPTFFEVRVGYVGPGISGENIDWPGDPLDEPADISWSTETRQVAYDRDLDGDLLCNIMGEGFDPPLTRDVKDPVLTIERNEAAFDSNDMLNYVDTICAEEYWGAAIGRARLTDMSGRSVAASTPYYRKSYRVTFRMRTPSGVTDANAWKRYILHMGTRYVDGVGVVQLAPNGQQVLLAADGTRVAAAAATWLGPFIEYGSASWADLAIGSGDV